MDGSLHASSLLLAAASPFLQEALSSSCTCSRGQERVLLIPWAKIGEVEEALGALVETRPKLSVYTCKVLLGLGINLGAGGKEDDIVFGDWDIAKIKQNSCNLHHLADEKHSASASEKLVTKIKHFNTQGETNMNNREENECDLLAIKGEPALEKHGLKRVLCNACGKTFSDKRELKVHEVGIHKEKTLPCQFCDKMFPSEKHRSKHENTVHTTELQYQCDECSKCFRHASSLHKHVLSSHRGEEAKKFMCKHCDKRFINKNKLKVHENTHTREKSYGCSLCGLTFSDQSALGRHKKIHAGDNKFFCDICPKTYSQSYDVVKHKMAVHGVASDAKKNDHSNKGKKIKREQKPGRFSEETLGIDVLL